MCSAAGTDTTMTIPTTITKDNKLRILLESDAPYLVPSDIYTSFADLKGKFPFSHSAMIPWTAQFVSYCANANVLDSKARWNADKVMREARNNARDMYGV